MLVPDALDVGLLLSPAPDVTPSLDLDDPAKASASPVCCSSPLLALEDGLLLELALELGLLLEFALDVGRLPPSLLSGEDELEPSCCCRWKGEHLYRIDIEKLKSHDLLHI